MKKKIFSVFLAALMLVCSLSACTEKGAAMPSFGDEAGSDTLRVCVDAARGEIPYIDARYTVTVYDDLAAKIKEACGIEKLVFEVIPNKTPERDNVIKRLRTEIMSGGGPDLFLVRTCLDTPDGQSYNGLFNFPEMSMESGIFLPLDEYMEKHTQFTDWEKQTKVVLDAGRTDEGQVIIPLSYTFPVTVYPKHASKIPYTTELTMWDILENPETAELGAVLYSAFGKSEDPETKSYVSNYDYIDNFGQLADFESEELLFTEDELFKVIETRFSLGDAINKNEHFYMRRKADYNLIYDTFNAYFDTEMTLVPTYSINGGVTATVQSFAGVNRNTSHSKEAFAVIDYLMQEDAQRGCALYPTFAGIPLQNDLGSEEKTLQMNYNPQRYLSEPLFEDFLQIKELITAVNFENELYSTLGQLQNSFVFYGTPTREDIEKSYASMQRMIKE